MPERFVAGSIDYDGEMSANFDAGRPLPAGMAAGSFLYRSAGGRRTT